MLLIPVSTSKQEFADEYGLDLIEVSMKDGTNIEMAITHMVGKLWRNMVRLKQNSEDKLGNV